MAEGFELRKFVAPEFIFGVGARSLAGRYARNMGGRKVLIVSDPGVIAAGWTKDVTDSLISWATSSWASSKKSGRRCRT